MSNRYTPRRRSKSHFLAAQRPGTSYISSEPMKKCLDCNSPVDEGAYVCANCGGSSLIGSYGGDDALAMLDQMSKMADAAKHVDQSAHFYQAGRLDDAIAELKIALEMAPQNATAHGNMGAVLAKQGKHKEAIPFFERALELNPGLEGVPQGLAEAKRKAGSGGGCFVATACYGDYDAPEVLTLRSFRDGWLNQHSLGRLFVRAYYKCSPPIADRLADHPILRSAVRRMFLTPLVQTIRRLW